MGDGDYGVVEVGGPAGREIGLEDELVLGDVARSYGDLADFEAHPTGLERADQRPVFKLRVLFVFRPFEQEVHAVRMGHDDDLRVGRHVQVVPDVAQRLGRLRIRVIDVVDHLVLGLHRQCARCQK